MLEFLGSILEELVHYSIFLFEFIGTVVILFAGLRGFVELLIGKSSTKLRLAKGLAMGLEFKLGSEILRTVVVRDLSEIFIVGAIILIRAALILLIHWEIRREEANELVLAKEENEKKEKEEK